EDKGIMYTVTFIRQYTNASVVYLYSDWDSTHEVTVYMIPLSSYVLKTGICFLNVVGSTRGLNSLFSSMMDEGEFKP
ncbi:hypothetical protein ACT453_59955, partial [Bacillus sp. D-CC]